MIVTLLNQLSNAAGNLLLRPWSADAAAATASPWFLLIVGSVAASAMMVVLFALSADQRQLRRRRNLLVARTLELALFRHDARVSFSACIRILRANAAYLAVFLRPTLTAIVPMILIFVQMAAWLQYRPLRIGEVTLLEVELDRRLPITQTHVQVTLSDSFVLDSEMVRIPATNSVCFRIRVIAEGDAWAEISSGTAVERKAAAIGPGVQKISLRRTQPDLIQQVLYPVERTLPRDSPFRRIEIRFPERDLRIGNPGVHWIVAAVLIMMLSGVVIGRCFGVSIA